MLVPSEVATNNLAKEGITKNVSVMGDIMKDLALMAIQENWIKQDLTESNYNYITLHRPYNVDQPERLLHILNTLNSLDQKCIFAIHPRTRNAMKKSEIMESQFQNIAFIDPQSYFNNLSYLYHAKRLDY